MFVRGVAEPKSLVTDYMPDLRRDSTSSTADKVNVAGNHILEITGRRLVGQIRRLVR